MQEYELYVPLSSKEQSRMASANRRALKKTLIKRFGGLTEFPQKQRGFWKVGQVTFHDEIVIWRILSNEPPARGERFWSTLKARLAREWRQQQVLIVRRAVDVV